MEVFRIAKSPIMNLQQPSLPLLDSSFDDSDYSDYDGESAPIICLKGLNDKVD